MDERRNLSRRSLGMWASGNSDRAEDIFADTYVNHQEPNAEGGVTSLDLAGWQDVVRQNHEAFPDLRVHILVQIAENDLVATRWRFEATQTGSYLGHPASGRRAVWSGVQIDRFADGRIVESWVDWDKYGLFAQLGFIE